jgi:hypothetical protein
LDGDVILAAQALLLARQEFSYTIATSNIKHLQLFAEAKNWQEI